MKPWPGWNGHSSCPVRPSRSRARSKGLRARACSRAGTLDRLIEQAMEKELITQEDAELFRRAEAARDQAIRVDAFTPEEYLP